MRGLVLVALLVLICPVWAQEARPLPAAGMTVPVEMARGTAACRLVVEQAGSFYLQLAATVPPQVGLEAIAYTVAVDDKPLRATAGSSETNGGAWNQGYMPYFLVDGDGPVKTLTFLLPLTFTPGAHTVAVTVPAGGRVSSLTFAPAIPALQARAALAGDSRVWYPGEAARGQVLLSGGAAGHGYTGAVIYQRLRLADAGDSAEWGPDIRVTPTAEARCVPLAVTCSPAGTAEAALDFPTDAHGLVGASVVLRDGPRLFARYLGAVAVVPRRPEPRYAADAPFLVSSNLNISGSRLRDYKRAGIDWLRVELGPGAFAPRPDQYHWTNLDRFYALCREQRVHVLTLMGGSPGWMQPKGDFVDVPYKSGTLKLDGSPGREFLPAWEAAWTAYLRRYGDVSRAMNLWNEPWEGGGISGWKSSGAHYRQQLSHLVTARNAVDKSIKIVAADSSHDTDWKIFAAGRQADIDVISTHYEHPRTSTAFAMARLYHKEVWETETWLSWEGDAASARRILYNLALGATRVSLWTDPMLFNSAGDPTPQLASLAAMRARLDGLQFRGILHPERPPFVLLFSGKDRQVAAVVSTLAINTAEANREFRGQFAGERLTMTLEDPTGAYRAYDLLGNPLAPARSGKMLQLPVDAEVRYLESRGAAAEFSRRLTAATYTGLRPVEIILHDLPQRLERRPALRVTLRNAYPTRLPVTVTVEAAALGMPAAAQRVTLKAGGETTLAFPVTAATPAGGNVYPVSVRVDSAQGTARLEELISVATIPRGTPVVDGDWAEWPRLGAVPAYLLPDRAKTPPELRPWLPARAWAQATRPGSTEVAFLADDRCLYVLARVRDVTRHEFPSLLAGANLHAMQQAPADYMYQQMGPWPERDGDLVELQLGVIGRQPWDRHYEVFPPGSPLYRLGAALPSRYTYVLYPTVEGAEVLRLRTPKFYYAHPLPMDYAWLAQHGRVDGAQVRATRDADGYVLEAALPWRELATLPHAAGDRIRLNVRVRDTNATFPLAWAGSREAGGTQYSWSKGRSIAGLAPLDYTPAGRTQWSAETEWGFE